MESRTGFFPGLGIKADGVWILRLIKWYLIYKDQETISYLSNGVKSSKIRLATGFGCSTYFRRKNWKVRFETDAGPQP